ncbi:hypothetical protein [Aerolutibacter ruishenii]|uniref:Uncharacterized protein n=1 Tax=Aerolutibacter ruishenii TaxID=686800 RepID=A0A562M0X3_9GAMM|nr:hypothetical protein [Lysobacter ruishenii]TWI13503.1 hypothetical protein IP93_00665 [Lysobacter ruishenii]
MNAMTIAHLRAEERRNAERRLVERRMSANRRQADRQDAAPAPLATVTPIRHQHRERDFGVGYGNSSGYAARGRYTTNWNQPHFRVA